MSLGVSADKDEFARVKTVVTDLITWLQVWSLPGTRHKSYCDDEMHKHVMREDSSSGSTAAAQQQQATTSQAGSTR